MASPARMRRRAARRVLLEYLRHPRNRLLIHRRCGDDVGGCAAGSGRSRRHRRRARDLPGVPRNGRPHRRSRVTAGRPTTVDVEEVRAHAAEQAERLFARL